MDNSANTIQNNALATLAAHAPQSVLNSIKRASAHTGVNFAYLMQQASAESSFNPAAKARGSSASGLYQFIESTWINMVKKYGDKYGMGDLAGHISDSGKVDSKDVKKQILALRSDPEKASALAAEFANENKQFLDDHWGGKVGSTELYLAHFMGAGGAASFLKAKDENPLQQAAVLFPDAARSNRNVFYDTSTGRPRSVGEIYAFFDHKFDIKGGGASPMPQTTQIADTSFDGHTQDVQSVLFNTGNFRSRAFGSLYSAAANANQLLANPVELILLGQADILPKAKNQYIF